MGDAYSVEGEDGKGGGSVLGVRDERVRGATIL